MAIKRKQGIIIGVSLIVIVCLILSSMYIYFEYYAIKKETPIQPTPSPIDTRISPLENQGVVLEVLRIRHRGLLEKLLKPGNSWKNKPTFYFVTNMDGLEYESRYVSQGGRTVEVYFNTWDTIFQENKIVKDVKEENQTAEVTLTIMEQVKSGLLGRKTSYVESDSFTVIYDFRTGRWSGDDEFKDYDGYGHYLGETFEIWFNLYQFDFDDDLIPYWTEVNILGTDPTLDDSKLDPDGDGIPTYWEWKWGYDPFTWDNHENLDPDLDGKENIEEYQMAEWFADPFIQDIYVEVDVMDSGGLFDPPHYFYEESKQGIIERFAEHNIRIYFDDGWANGPSNGGGELLPHIDKISQESGMMLQYYTNNFAEERRGIFLYLLIGHLGGFQHPSINNLYDTIQVAYCSSKFLFAKGKLMTDFISMGTLPNQRGRRIALGGALLHEFAHCCSVNDVSCDLGGIDNMSYGLALLPNKQYKETWGQYHSVMNYLYTRGPKTFDLSDGKNGPPYDQNDWSMMFVGYSNYMSPKVEQSFNALDEEGTIAGETTDQVEWRITGYTYDVNLTEKYVKYIGDYSPIDPIQVNWSVYKILDKEKNPNYKEIKVFAQPKIKTTQQWVLYCEGDLDSQGNLQFYSYDDILEDKMNYSTTT
jgi:hypothetical protein